jgi:hypothetical protein
MAENPLDKPVLAVFSPVTSVWEEGTGCLPHSGEKIAEYINIRRIQQAIAVFIVR